ncbi:hypothetical protein [Antarcticimicrobium luteum]|uniref:Uncharacterized protein n=1 Tax=Antarcticimicrobium luteum TaxID=2547397 RepID=A0A4R5VHX8_9RHOB|nr:hypothetical protein [Antarcticimicrobium luteum]TDK52142.1 hypothetical protein E1832_01890 [Antarcticimicrobium luteum]
MLELFLVMFAAAVQTAGQDVAVAPAPAVNPAPTEDSAAAANAPPAFLAPAARAEEPAPVFLAPAAGGGAASDAPPAFLAPQPAAKAEAPPVFLAPAAQAPAAGLVAEPQVPSGRFTTAIEVKPIMSATKGNWIAIRQYDGKDYLYVTQIWSWRCGLAQMRFGVNGAPLQVWPLPPCHEEYSTPNAIIETDGNPMLTYPPGTIATVEIELTYDDLTTERAQFSRASVLMP